MERRGGKGREGERGGSGEGRGEGRGEAERREGEEGKGDAIGYCKQRATNKLGTKRRDEYREATNPYDEREECIRVSKKQPIR